MIEFFRLVRLRDHTLRVAAAIAVLFGAVLCLATIAIPGTIGVRNGVDLAPFAFLAVLVMLFFGLAQVRPGGELASLGLAAAGLATMAIVNLAPHEPAHAPFLAILGGIVLPSSAYVLTLNQRHHLTLLAVILIGVSATASTFTPVILGGREPGDLVDVPAALAGVAISLGGWVSTISVSFWLGQATRHAARHLDAFATAHRTERAASEAEAERRREARLLHDTALSTLTLIAHRGGGVSLTALRKRSRQEAKLLADLRSGRPVSATEPLDTVGGEMRSLRSFFEERGSDLGLSIAWHGENDLPLHPAAREALVGALVECLENVRRHARVSQAEVSVSSDEAMVRVIVTDLGVGYDPDIRTGDSLGVAESVLGRLASVGGRARVYSSLGAGTTVMMEVPRQ